MNRLRGHGQRPGKDGTVTGELMHVALAAGLFVGSHFLLSSPPVRDPLVAMLGEKPFQGLYSLIALALIIWLAMAYNAAPSVAVWWPPIGLQHVSLTVMVVASILVVGALTTPSPTAAGTDAEALAARGPVGLARITRHPMMWGIGLWGISHLLANGDAAAMILFGSLTFLALAGPLAIDAKRRMALGPVWQGYARQTSYIPFAAIAAGRTRFVMGEIGWWRLGLGVLVYIALLAVHPLLFGVAPWPM